MGPKKAHTRSQPAQSKSTNLKPPTDELNIKLTSRKRSASGALVKNKHAEIDDKTERAVADEVPDVEPGEEIIHADDACTEVIEPVGINEPEDVDSNATVTHDNGEADKSPVNEEPRDQEDNNEVATVDEADESLAYDAEIEDDKESEAGHTLVWKCDQITAEHSRVFTKPSLPSVLHRQRTGLAKSSHSYNQSMVSPIMSYTSQFKVSKLASPFDRRVTAIAWHPRYTRLCAAGSKSGDLVLWDTSKKVEGDIFKDMIKGRGPGGSVQSLVLDEGNSDRFYTASIDGTVASQLYSDKEGCRKKVFLETNDWERWYTGLDISFTSSLLVAGSNRGIVSLLSLEGEKVWDLKLHKSKCNFVQFSNRQPWMMVTSSVDKLVKIWDIRSIASKDSALAVLPHDKPVNSAHFSLVSGDKLLTTDQHSQLRVYQAPSFNTYQTIPHPHRQFQHLTPIKATWHPLTDIVVVGRYPDPKFPSYLEGERRTIDFFSGVTGESLLQLHQPGLDKIMSLSQFNTSGDLMLSSLAGSLLLWKAKPDTSDGEEDTTSQVLEDSWPDFTSKVKRKVQKKKVIIEEK